MVAVGGVLIASLFFIAWNRRDGPTTARWVVLFLISLVVIVALAIIDAGNNDH